MQKTTSKTPREKVSFEEVLTELQQEPHHEQLTEKEKALLLRAVRLLNSRPRKARWMQPLMAISGLILIGCCLWVLVDMEPPEGNRELFIHMLGIVEGFVVTVYSYYFGSSGK